MYHFSRLQIFDLEVIPSVFEQELTVEDAEKIVGGINSSNAITFSSAISIPKLISVSARPKKSDSIKIYADASPELPAIFKPKPPVPTPPIIDPSNEMALLQRAKVTLKRP